MTMPKNWIRIRSRRPSGDLRRRRFLRPCALRTTRRRRRPPTAQSAPACPAARRRLPVRRPGAATPRSAPAAPAAATPPARTPDAAKPPESGQAEGRGSTGETVDLAQRPFAYIEGKADRDEVYGAIQGSLGLVKRDMDKAGAEAGGTADRRVHRVR